jgi:hypothetical protein
MSGGLRGQREGLYDGGGAGLGVYCSLSAARPLRFAFARYRQRSARGEKPSLRERVGVVRFGECGRGTVHWRAGDASLGGREGRVVGGGGGEGGRGREVKAKRGVGGGRERTGTGLEERGGNAG